MTPAILIATTDAQIADCFAAMAELRPHLQEAEFVGQVRRLQATTGFRLAYLADPAVQCVAGFRVSEWLAGGRYLEVEDLVSVSGARSRGYGRQMFDWLCETARGDSCSHLRLVSRTHREAAHRFYERMGMSRDAYYFSMQL